MRILQLYFREIGLRNGCQSAEEPTVAQGSLTNICWLNGTWTSNSITNKTVMSYFYKKGWRQPSKTLHAVTDPVTKNSWARFHSIGGCFTALAVEVVALEEPDATLYNDTSTGGKSESTNICPEES